MFSNHDGVSNNKSFVTQRFKSACRKAGFDERIDFHPPDIVSRVIWQMQERW